MAKSIWNSSSLNLNLRVNSRGVSMRPYIKVANRRGLLGLLFGPRIKL